MIRSMTGFASVSRDLDGDAVAVTIKSVNHRFLDVSLKMPQALMALEQRVKGLIAARLSRGRVEVQVTWSVTRVPERDVVIDERLVEQITAAVDGMRARGLVSGPLSAADLLRVPQVLDVRTKGPDLTADLADVTVGLVEGAVAEALDALVAMRETEGRFLAADLDGRLGLIIGCVDALEREAAAGQLQLESRLRDRVSQLPPDLQVEPTALAQEIVRFVSRSDVDEEVVRLRGHLEHWRGLVAAAEPCGRKLDFLVQEMNREVNTIGSKVEGARVTELVISAKAELERVKEQVQNVE